MALDLRDEAASALGIAEREVGAGRDARGDPGGEHPRPLGIDAAQPERTAPRRMPEPAAIDRKAQRDIARAARDVAHRRDQGWRQPRIDLRAEQPVAQFDPVGAAVGIEFDQAQRRALS